MFRRRTTLYDVVVFFYETDDTFHIKTEMKIKHFNFYKDPLNFNGFKKN